MDGGLISNNPTCDMLTEIHEYNVGLRMIVSGIHYVSLAISLSVSILFYAWLSLIYSSLLFMEKNHRSALLASSYLIMA